LLIVDQFEELFTQVDDEIIRQQFLDLLTTAIAEIGLQLRLIVCMRGDFYDRPLKYREFGNLLKHNTEVILPLDIDEIEQAIVAPASNVGLDIETSLVSAIVADMQSQIGALPLMQYTLSELFRNREDNILTLSAYRSLGGVHGTLAKQAEELYLKLMPEKQTITHQVFSRIVSISDEGEITRRQVSVSELRTLTGDIHALQDVLDTFDRSRLLTFDHDPQTREPMVEVAHEALFKSWDRLNRWISEHQDSIRQRQLLQRLIKDWQQTDKEESYLLQGARLVTFEDWLSSTTLALTPDERDFIQQSLDQRESIRAATIEQQAYELTLIRQSRNRLGYLLVTFAIAAIITTILSLVSINQTELAVERAHEAESFTLLANAERAISSGDMSLAVQMVQSASQLPKTERAIVDTAHKLSTLPGITTYWHAHDDAITAMAFTPDGTTLITGAGVTVMGRLPAFDDEDAQAYPHGIEPPTDSQAKSSEDDPRGDRPPPPRPNRAREQLEAAVARDTTIAVWDVNTGELQQRINLHVETITDIIVLPDGKTVASASVDGGIYVWDLDSGMVLQSLAVLPIAAVYLSADDSDRLLVTRHNVTEDRYALFDLNTGERLELIEPAVPGNPIRASFTATGDIVSALASEIFVRWDPSTGDIRQQANVNRDVGIPESDEYNGNLTPDGNYWVQFLPESVMLWDLSDNSISEYFIQGNRFVDIAMHDDLVTVLNRAGDIIQFDAASQDANIRVLRSIGVGETIRRNPRGDMFAIGHADGSIEIWDDTPSPPDLILQGVPEQGISQKIYVSLDGNTIVTLARTREPGERPTNNVLVTDSASGDAYLLQRSAGAPPLPKLRAIAFSNDGRTILSGTSSYPLSTDSEAYLNVWSLDEQRELGEINLGPSGHINSIVTIPDETQHYLLGVGSEVQVWDLATETVLATYGDFDDMVMDVAIVDAIDAIAAVALDNTLKVWDRTSGAALFESESANGVAGLATHPTQPWVVYLKAPESLLVIQDITTGDVIHTFEGTAQIEFVEMSSDGLWLLTGQGDGTFIWWDIETGAVIERYILPTGLVDGQFTANDTQLVLFSNSTGYQFWNAKPRDADSMLAWLQGNRYARLVQTRDCQTYVQLPFDLCNNALP